MNGIKDINLVELKIIGEIALFAEEEKTRPFKHLANLCRLLLDPLYESRDSSSRGGGFEAEDLKYGRWLDLIYQNHCFGGPFVIRPPTKYGFSNWDAQKWLDETKRTITRIGRQLSLEQPGRVLVDVSGPIRILSYPDHRILGSPGSEPRVAEQFWVPGGDPQGWTTSSVARVPLNNVDFRTSLPEAFQLRVSLIDPDVEQKGRPLILDRFRRACRDHEVRLDKQG